MISNGMDTTAPPPHPTNLGSSLSVSMLIVTLLLFCGVLPALHARPATDRPGVTDLLRGALEPDGSTARCDIVDVERL